MMKPFNEWYQQFIIILLLSNFVGDLKKLEDINKSKIVLLNQN